VQQNTPLAPINFVEKAAFANPTSAIPASVVLNPTVSQDHAAKYRFARVSLADIPAITAHFSALNIEDRVLRFGHAASDEVMTDYARRLNFNRDIAEGAWENDRLVGFAQLAVYAENGYAAGELAISVLPEARGQQIGSRLVRGAVDRAYRYGLVRLYINYMRRNLSMAHLVRRFAATITHNGDSAQATIALAAAQDSVYTEVLRAGHADRLEVFRRAPLGPSRGNVLFVHGLGGDGWQWRKLLAQTALDGYSAYALSLSGHGGSANAEPSLEGYIRDVDEVLRELPTDTRLVGHSLGGYLVQESLTRVARPAAVLLAPVPPDVPRGRELERVISALEGDSLRVLATRILADVPTLKPVNVTTPITLISGDTDQVIPVALMRDTAAQYRARWTRLDAGHNLPAAMGVAGPLLVGLSGDTTNDA
jgi:pimeloyl-ACP methyl ester carboxylesterase/GNAT superfamily N-acetyltransferase